MVVLALGRTAKIVDPLFCALKKRGGGVYG